MCYLLSWPGSTVSFRRCTLTPSPSALSVPGCSSSPNLEKFGGLFFAGEDLYGGASKIAARLFFWRPSIFLFLGGAPWYTRMHPYCTQNEHQRIFTMIWLTPFWKVVIQWVQVISAARKTFQVQRILQHNCTSHRCISQGHPYQL